MTMLEGLPFQGRASEVMQLIHYTMPSMGLWVFLWG